MDKEYNRKRLYPPFWQHDYHTLIGIKKILECIISKYLAKSKKKLVLLDYGCGNKPYQSLFLPYLSNYIGVDIGDNNQADIIIKESEKIPLKKMTIDAVLSTQVLEHVRDANFYLAECLRLLKRNGLIILSTHGLWPYHKFPKDYRRYTREGLVAEVENAGFKIIDLYSVLGPYGSIIQYEMLIIAERLRHKSYLFKLLLFLISIIGNILIPIYDLIFTSDKDSDASVYVLCAVKKSSSY